MGVIDGFSDQEDFSTGVKADQINISDIILDPLLLYY